MFWNQKVSSRKWGSRDMQLVEQWVGTPHRSSWDSGPQLTNLASVTSRNVSASSEPRTT